MSKKLTVTALSATLALFALTAHAQPAPEGDVPPPPPHEEGKPPMGADHKGMMGDHKANRPNFLFKKMDTNGDGKVTKAEHDVFVEARFKETDANNDGAITEEEMKAYGDKKREEHMKKMMEERKNIIEKQGSEKDVKPTEKK
jgi:hypothetical protein